MRRQQRQQPPGRHGYGHLNRKRGGGSRPHVQGPVPGAQDQGGEQGLVRKLAEEGKPERDGGSSQVGKRGNPSVGRQSDLGILLISLRPDALNSRRSRPPRYCDPVAGHALRASMSTSRKKDYSPSNSTYHWPAAPIPGSGRRRGVCPPGAA